MSRGPVHSRHGHTSFPVPYLRKTSYFLQKLVDTFFKPEIECRALTTRALCVANSKCVYEDDGCTANSDAIMNNPPPSSCKDSEKQPVTLTTVVVQGSSKCGANSDEAAC